MSAAEEKLGHEGLYRYCPFEMLEEAFARGWCFAVDENRRPIILHSPHGHYAALVRWLCWCEARWPGVDGRLK